MVITKDEKDSGVNILLLVLGVNYDVLTAGLVRKGAKDTKVLGLSFWGVSTQRRKGHKVHVYKMFGGC